MPFINHVQSTTTLFHIGKFSSCQNLFITAKSILMEFLGSFHYCMEILSITTQCTWS